MRLLRLNGALLPLAPVLLPEVSRHAHGSALRDVWDAIDRLVIAPEAEVVVVTPHGGGSFVYRTATGSLATYGLEGLGYAGRPGSLIDELASAWDRPVIDRALDRGALVPLMLLDVANEVTMVALDDLADAAQLAAVLRSLAGDRELFVIASADTSASLSERAPLRFRPEAVRLETKLVAGIETDARVAAEIAPDLASVGGSSSAPTLSLFGTLFAGAEAQVLAYAYPFGVGYLVARATVDV